MMSDLASNCYNLKPRRHLVCPTIGVIRLLELARCFVLVALSYKALGGARSAPCGLYNRNGLDNNAAHPIKQASGAGRD